MCLLLFFDIVYEPGYIQSVSQKLKWMKLHNAYIASM